MAVELLPKILPNILPKTGTGRSFGSIAGSDIADLIRAVGLPCPLFLDVRRGMTTQGSTLTGWLDARGYGTALAGVSPTVNGDGSLTFNGTTQYLRLALGLGSVTGDCALVAVMKGQTSVAGRAFELSVLATGSLIAAQQSAGPIWSVQALANAAMVADAASPQVLHARRKVGSLVGSQVGTAAEVTAVSATGAQTASRFTIGGDRTDAVGSFAPIDGLRAVMIFAGDYAGKQALVNAWAQKYHSALP